MRLQHRADVDEDAVGVRRFLHMDGGEAAVGKFGEVHGLFRALGKLA